MAVTLCAESTPFGRGLFRYAQPGTPIFLIDPKPIRLDYDKFTQIQEPATVGMEKLKQILLDEYL